ncbi:hypothetical protein KR100_07235 [Synechococcus sp. KORDI-100]|nr:hypothetical protein KR100_07235 [Synechococcus sp. KORDI-100]
MALKIWRKDRDSGEKKVLEAALCTVEIRGPFWEF